MQATSKLLDSLHSPIKGNSVLKAGLLGRYAMHSPHCIIIIIDCTDLPTRRASSGGGGRGTGGGTGVVVVPVLLICTYYTL